MKRAKRRAPGPVLATLRYLQLKHVSPWRDLAAPAVTTTAAAPTASHCPPRLLVLPDQRPATRETF